MFEAVADLGGGAPGRCHPPYLTELYFVYGFLYTLVKAKLACAGVNTIDILSTLQLIYFSK